MILFIDDYQDLVKNTCKLVHLSGIQLHGFDDPNEAMQTIQTHEHEIKLAFVDLRLKRPGTNLYFWQELLAYEFKVIMITGSDPSDPLLQNPELPKHHKVIHKPFESNEIIQAIQATVEK